MLEVFAVEQSDRRRLVESPRPGARWIEEANAVDDLIVRQMTVAEDDDIGALARQRLRDVIARLRRTRKNVRDEKTHAAERDAHDLAAVAAVVVAAHERDRGNRAQRIEDVIAADIAGVHDDINARKDLRDPRMNDAVRAPDHPDPHKAILN